MSTPGHDDKKQIAPLFSNDSKQLLTSKSGIIHISQGPQFRTTGGIAFAFLFLAFFLIAVACLFNALFLLFLVFGSISTLLISLVLDMRGIEVDTALHKIRQYKAVLWFRLGEWADIKDYKTIYLTRKNVVVRTSEYSEHSTDTYHYYHIKLVDELNKKEILLAEYKNYYKARQISLNISDAVGFEFKDFVKGIRKESHWANTTRIK